MPIPRNLHAVLVATKSGTFPDPGGQDSQRASVIDDFLVVAAVEQERQDALIREVTSWRK